MIKVSNVDICTQTDMFVNGYRDSSNAPFLEDAFMKKSFGVLEKRVGRKYPYEVKIPKSFLEMLDGDFNPARIIVVREPIKGAYSNIWFGDTTDGVHFRCGYVNGDSRYISEQALDDKTPHGFLAGATGQGKSVTLNSIIYGMCSEYAPWELKLVLSDAKIVEFKSIALNDPMPQIDIVAATGDSDYLLSVLETKYNEMQTLNSIFTKASQVYGQTIHNIKDFRKVTGLTLPRNVLVFDEATSMFANAGKKVNKLVELIAKFAALGRNTGYHMLLTSQEVSSDLPDKTLANLALRGALGCTAAVSSKVLGNEEAKNNLGKKGRLLFNANNGEGSKDANVLIRVPYMPGEQSTEIAKAVIKQGEAFKVTPVLRFYDEQDFLYEDRYDKFLENFPADGKKLYLGPPSFIMSGEEQCLSLALTRDDGENICAIGGSANNNVRLFKMLSKNVMRIPGAVNIVLCANSLFYTECNLEQLAKQNLYDERNYEGSSAIQITISTIYRRSLCLRVDELVFKNPSVSEVSDTQFYENFEKGSSYDTLTNRSRWFYTQGLLESDANLAIAFKFHNASDDVKYEKRCNLASAVIKMCEQYGAAERRLVVDDLPMLFSWILGADRVLGFGRDNNTRNTAEFKKAMTESTAVNVRFIVFTNTFEELTDLKRAFRWYILDGIPDVEKNRIKCEDYPAQVSSVLAVLFDTIDNENPCRKFKKMFLKGEQPM